MSNRSLPDITTFLTNEIVQERVRRNMQRIRREAMVTIGEAARLFGFSESQLRDWERLGLIKPVRPVEGAEDARNVRRQRQYSFEELDKLAAIYELLRYNDLTPGQIAQQMGRLQVLLPSIEETALTSAGEAQDKGSYHAADHEQRYIVQHTETIYQQLFSRHYTSRALFLAIRLLYEDMPGTSVGLILPVHKRYPGEPIPTSDTLASVGHALVGWLGQTRSFYTFLTPSPAFEFPSDFLIYPLPANTAPADSLVEDATLIAVQRGKERRLRHTNKSVRILVQRLLAPIYEEKQQWETYFGHGLHSLAYPDIDYSSSSSDALLTGFAHMAVRLGGQRPDGEDKWGFSCILLANDTRLPLYQRDLVVRAASKYIHEIDGVTINSFEHSAVNLGSRAFLSSCVVLRSELVPDDPSLLFRHLDEPVRSHIAIPIGGELEAPIGILYITSPWPSAFSEEDQQLLRLIARLIEEVLHTYEAKQKLAADLTGLLKAPAIADTSLKEFLTENDFITDLNSILHALNLPSREELSAIDYKKVTSDVGYISEMAFITVEIDNQEMIANSYGDRTLKAVNKSMGSRISRLLPALIARYTDCKLYYIWSGRFYLFLRDFSAEETLMYAERLWIALNEDILLNQSELPDGRLSLPIKVHAGVNWYSSEKLREMLDELQSVARVSDLIYRSLDSVLRLGGDKGGNLIVFWNRETKTYDSYTPKK
jgi:DNA-binding transcriptional MerR regulator/GAF domain-containing protein